MIATTIVATAMTNAGVEGFGIARAVFLAMSLAVGVGYALISALHPKKNRTKTLRNDDIATINTYNDLVSASSNVQEMITSAVNTKQREIMLANDYAALTLLSNAVSAANYQSRIISDYFTRAKKLIDEKNYAGAKYCCERIKDAIVSLNQDIRRIESIKINESKKKAPSQKSSEVKKDLVFFGDCKNKEDAASRFRKLSKAFHPDEAGGSRELFEKMKEEYEGLSFEK